MSEHVTATEAEQAALAGLRDGDELIVYDCYHRCHRVRRASPAHSTADPRRPSPL